MSACCPGCGEPLGARYDLGDGRKVCWPCTGLEPLAPERRPDPAWVRFRKKVGDALDRIAPQRFVYLDEDGFLHICPVCRASLPAYLSVRFHGRMPRATIRCSLGCPDDETAKTLGIDVLEVLS